MRDVTFAPRLENVYALTNANRLLVFNSGNPGTINNTINITGPASGENVVAIDFRPGTGQLFGVTNASRIYFINKTTGVATQVGTAALHWPTVHGRFAGSSHGGNGQLRHRSVQQRWFADCDSARRNFFAALFGESDDGRSHTDWRGQPERTDYRVKC